MERKVLAVLLLAVSIIAYAGIVSGHQPYEDLEEGSDYGMHHTEMLELHRQYFSNEITLDEFHERMEMEMNESGKYQSRGMPCYGGFGMMGFPLFPSGGMMW